MAATFQEDKKAVLPLPDCARCPVLAANRHQVVQGYGSVPARLIIVGEAPGYRGADRTGVPFTGDRSGYRLQAVLIALGLSAETDPKVETPRLRGCYLTNLVRCNPPHNRTPRPVEIANCRPFLEAELDFVQPELVVAVGRLAADALCDLLDLPYPGAVDDFHAHPLRARHFTLLPIRHPSRASRAQMEAFRAALAKLLKRDRGFGQAGKIPAHL